MSSFEPVPGVWYTTDDVYDPNKWVGAYHPQHVYVYAPRQRFDDFAWVDAEGTRLNDVEVTGYVGGRPQHDLVEVFNLHAVEYSYIEPHDKRRWPTTQEDVDNYRNANYTVQKRYVTEWENI